jgi:hypothetical protein
MSAPANEGDQRDPLSGYKRGFGWDHPTRSIPFENSMLPTPPRARPPSG